MFKKSLKNLYGVLYKNAVIIMVVATLCVVLSVSYVSMQVKPTYTARAEMLLHNHSLSEIPSGMFVQSEVSTVDTSLEIFNSQSLFTSLIESKRLETKHTAKELNEMIEVTRKSKDSLVLCVEVTCDTAGEAKELVKGYTSFMQEYYSLYTADFFVSLLYIDDHATLNRPNIALVVVTSLVVGALLASIAVIIIDKLNLKLRGVSDYRSRYSAPLLGSVPDFSAKKKEDN